MWNSDEEFGTVETNNMNQNHCVHHKSHMELLTTEGVSALTTTVTSRLYSVCLSLSFPDDLSASVVKRRNVPASRVTNLSYLC
jgi:hypothetical protein